MRDLRVIHLADQYEAALNTPFVSLNRLAAELREKIGFELTRDEAVAVFARAANTTTLSASDWIAVY